MDKNLIENAGPQNHTVETGIMRYATTKAKLRKAGGFRPVPQHVQHNLLDDFLQACGEVHMLLRKIFVLPSWMKSMGIKYRPEHVGCRGTESELIVTLVSQ